MSERLPRLELTLRLLLAVLTLTLGVLVATVGSHRYRALEATVASLLSTTFSRSYSIDDRWIVRSGNQALILVVTPSCTTSLLVGPLCVLAAFLLVLRRMRILRTLGALIVGLAVLMTLGFLRMGLISWSWYERGPDAAWFSHEVLGTFISVVSATAALAVMLWYGTRGPAHRGRQHTSAP